MLYFEIECKNCGNIFTNYSMTSIKVIPCPECRTIAEDNLKILRCIASTKISIPSTNK